MVIVKIDRTKAIYYIIIISIIILIIAIATLAFIDWMNYLHEQAILHPMTKEEWKENLRPVENYNGFGIVTLPMIILFVVGFASITTIISVVCSSIYFILTSYLMGRDPFDEREHLLKWW
jgi:hypothetical protein